MPGSKSLYCHRAHCSGGVEQPYLQGDVQDQHHDQRAEDGIHPCWVGNALTFSKVAHGNFLNPASPSGFVLRHKKVVALGPPRA
jgi:hypothetical protein